MTKQPEYNSMTDWCLRRQRVRCHKQTKKDSETDFSTDSDYSEFANEIPFVGNILQPFQFEASFTAAEGCSPLNSMMSGRRSRCSELECHW